VVVGGGGLGSKSKNEKLQGVKKCKKSGKCTRCHDTVKKKVDRNKESGPKVKSNNDKRKIEPCGEKIKLTENS